MVIFRDSPRDEGITGSAPIPVKTSERQSDAIVTRRDGNFDLGSSIRKVSRNPSTLLTRHEALTSGLAPRQTTAIPTGRDPSKFRTSASGTCPKRASEFGRLDESDTTPAHLDLLCSNCNRGTPARGC